MRPSETGLLNCPELVIAHYFAPIAARSLTVNERWRISYEQPIAVITLTRDAAGQTEAAASRKLRRG